MKPKTKIAVALGVLLCALLCFLVGSELFQAQNEHTEEERGRSRVRPHQETIDNAPARAAEKRLESERGEVEIEQPKESTLYISATLPSKKYRKEAGVSIRFYELDDKESNHLNLQNLTPNSNLRDLPELGERSSNWHHEATDLSEELADVWQCEIVYPPTISALYIVFDIRWPSVLSQPTSLGIESDSRVAIADGLSQRCLLIDPGTELELSFLPQTFVEGEVQFADKSVIRRADYDVYIQQRGNTRRMRDFSGIGMFKPVTPERARITRFECDFVIPGEKFTIIVTPSSTLQLQGRSALAFGFSHAWEQTPIAAGSARKNLILRLPPTPRLFVQLPNTEEFENSHWRVSAEFVDSDGERLPKSVTIGFVHKPGMPTWYSENPLGPELHRLKREMLKEGSHIGNSLDFEDFLGKARPLFRSQRMKFTFSSKSHDPLTAVKEFDLGKNDFKYAVNVQLSPTSFSRKFRVRVVTHHHEPVEGVRLLVEDVGGDSAGWKVAWMTTDSGEVEIDAPASNLQIIASKKGFANARKVLLARKGNEVSELITLRLFPQKSASLTLSIADESAGPWEMERDGEIWAMVVSDQPDPMRIMHNTWEAVSKKVDVDGKMEFTNIPPGKYLVTVLANGRQPWVKELVVPRDKSTEESLDVSLKKLGGSEARIAFSSVGAAIGEKGGMKLGFKRQFALVQGDFGAFTNRIINILRGEIVWKRVKGSPERQPYPFLPTTLLGESPESEISASLDPSLPTWLVGPSGAILPMVKEGNTYKPDASKTATVRGSVLGMAKFDNLIARVVPVNARNALKSPYNVLSGVSTQIDKSGNFVVKHLLPGTYRILLLKPNPGGDGASAVTVLNRNKNAIITLIAKEDQTFNLEAE